MPSRILGNLAIAVTTEQPHQPGRTDPLRVGRGSDAADEVISIPLAGKVPHAGYVLASAPVGPVTLKLAARPVKHP
jgi:hypothetical protein